MVRVKALQRVYYGGKEYAKDDELDISEREAVALGALRKVLRAETTPQQSEPEAAPSLDEPPKGRHKRRDLKAED